MCPLFHVSYNQRHVCGCAFFRAVNSSARARDIVTYAQQPRTELLYIHLYTLSRSYGNKSMDILYIVIRAHNTQTSNSLQKTFA